ncbi:unnamed protein product [Blumeria hordei]|uniref:Histone-lysine N-methyltransferase n=1 Tax=Blumeria hordei TaxID=2867405 RepID=A0A383V0Q4_BLUHO|nr:unnamed protein product [Blumeria hordei]
MLPSILGLITSPSTELSSKILHSPSGTSINSAISVHSADGYSDTTISSLPISVNEVVSEKASTTVNDMEAMNDYSDSMRPSIRARKSTTSYNITMLSRTAIEALERVEQNLKVVGASNAPNRDKSFGTSNNSISTIKTPSTRSQRERPISSFGNGEKYAQQSLSAKARSAPRNMGANIFQKEQGLVERRLTRSSSQKSEIMTSMFPVLAKRDRRKSEGSNRKKNVNRELNNLIDSNEFAKIDTEPVIHEVWSNGKLVVESNSQEREKSRRNNSSRRSIEDSIPPRTNSACGEGKIWLSKGLYAGQDWSSDRFVRGSGTKNGEKSTDDQYTPNRSLPLPMWYGRRLLEFGRDFKLPFDVCSPLPPGQPQPDEWRKATKNRFIGDAGALWKVSKFSYSTSSKCVCKPENGCGEDCQNRIMFYECDDANCAVGSKYCTNRAFAELQERRKAGGKYRVGVEVIKTADRGYGVRSNRCFEPHQIIVEYTGEIITEDECDRRMNEDYKDNDCYYLMSFDQSMIIDATKGSIARFVNHSCKPNCRMVKWIVGGNPRMALFAGDEPIMTGDELTYDYKFDPFSSKNIQQCRCGSNNCRGVLGPRLKDSKLIRDFTKDCTVISNSSAKIGKRKVMESPTEKDINSTRSPKRKKIENDSDQKLHLPEFTADSKNNMSKVEIDSTSKPPQAQFSIGVRKIKQSKDEVRGGKKSFSQNLNTKTSTADTSHGEIFSKDSSHTERKLRSARKTTKEAPGRNKRTSVGSSERVKGSSRLQTRNLRSVNK